jgi:hypothetical protein
MLAKLICYSLEKPTQTIRTALNREINGYKDFSDHGKYVYQRKGILHEIEHNRPHKSVIIVKKADEEKIMSVLKKYNAKINAFDISIDSKHLKKPLE